MKLISVVGARPNFMKIAPIVRQLSARSGVDHLLVHTGQHYDEVMSDQFFAELGLPRPDVNLGIGSGTHAEQTAKALVGFERILLEHRPDWVLVVGDVNSTLACALAAAKLHIRIAHVEAGLRSFDRGMSEEINRILTDALSELLFATSEQAQQQLVREGIPSPRIHVVGNVMIDALLMVRQQAAQSGVVEGMRLQPRSYGVVTLHRAETVDDPHRLRQVGLALEQLAGELPLIFPVHPRTAQRLKQAGLWSQWTAVPGLRLNEPLGYADFVGLLSQAKVVLTDSGGVQEEAAWLGLPCVTLRDCTEWNETVEAGSNVLAGTESERIVTAARSLLVRHGAAPMRPPLWDGCAAERIVDVLVGKHTSLHTKRR